MLLYIFDNRGYWSHANHIQSVIICFVTSNQGRSHEQTRPGLQIVLYDIKTTFWDLNDNPVYPCLTVQCILFYVQYITYMFYYCILFVFLNTHKCNKLYCFNHIGILLFTKEINKN